MTLKERQKRYYQAHMDKIKLRQNLYRARTLVQHDAHVRDLAVVYGSRDPVNWRPRSGLSFDETNERRYWIGQGLSAKEACEVALSRRADEPWDLDMRALSSYRDADGCINLYLSPSCFPRLAPVT